jgi:hypothetical protein
MSAVIFSLQVLCFPPFAWRPPWFHMWCIVLSSRWRSLCHLLLHLFLDLACYVFFFKCSSHL